MQDKGHLGEAFSMAALAAQAEHIEALTGFYPDARGGRTIDLRQAPDRLKADADVVAAVMRRNGGGLPEDYKEDRLIAETAAAVIAQKQGSAATSPKGPGQG
jgi:hypothetical protein